MNKLSLFKNAPLIYLSQRKNDFFSILNYSQRKHLFVHNPCKNGSSRTTSKSVLWHTILTPTKHEFALQGAIFNVKYSQSYLFWGIWTTGTCLSIRILLIDYFYSAATGYAKTFTLKSLFFKSYCGIWCSSVKQLSKHLFNNFVVNKYV